MHKNRRTCLWPSSQIDKTNNYRPRYGMVNIIKRQSQRNVMEEVTFEPSLESWRSYTGMRGCFKQQDSVCKGSKLVLYWILINLFIVSKAHAR